MDGIRIFGSDPHATVPDRCRLIGMANKRTPLGKTEPTESDLYPLRRAHGEALELVPTRRQRWRDNQGGWWHLQTSWAIVDGRAEPVALVIEAPRGRALKADDLRAIPLGGLFGDERKNVVEYLTVMRAEHALVAQHVEAGLIPEGVIPGGAEAEQELADSYAAALEAFGARGGRATKPAELLKVAEAYKAAVFAGDNVKRAVMEACGLESESGAAKRIAAARAAGLLGPARVGKAGEQK